MYTYILLSKIQYKIIHPLIYHIKYLHRSNQIEQGGKTHNSAYSYRLHNLHIHETRLIFVQRSVFHDHIFLIVTFGNQNTPVSSA